MPFDIATGTYTDATALQPLDATGLPALAGTTPVTPVASGPADSGPLQGGVMPTTAMFGEQAAAGTADCAAAMSAGMDARTSMLSHYQGSISDGMTIPLVPDTATPAVQSDLYPYAGQEPTPAAAGLYIGNEPTLPE